MILKVPKENHLFLFLFSTSFSFFLMTPPLSLELLFDYGWNAICAILIYSQKIYRAACKSVFCDSSLPPLLVRPSSSLMTEKCSVVLCSLLKFIQRAILYISYIKSSTPLFCSIRLFLFYKESHDCF